MKKVLCLLAFLLLPSAASAQCSGVFPPSSFCGTNAGGPPKALPFSSFFPNLNVGNSTITGGSSNDFLYNNAGKLGSKALPVLLASLNGFAQDGITDDTNALNAFLTSACAGPGATLMFSGISAIKGQITFPASCNYVRLTGNGAGGLDLQYNAAVAKFLATGTGTLSLYNMIIKDTNTDCATFFRITYTEVDSDENHFIGSTAAPNACNDVFSFGGSGGILGAGNSNSAFQGYPFTSTEDSYSNIKRPGVYGSYANAIVFTNPHVDLTCSNNATLAITGATNASPAVLTIASARFKAGDLPIIKISGFTGNWAPLNGSAVQATALSATTFSVAVDSTTFGAMTGSPVIPDGEMFAVLGTSPSLTQSGNQWIGGIYEMAYYGYFAKLANGTKASFEAVGMYDDAPGTTVAYLQADTSYTYGSINFAYTVGVNGPGNTPYTVGASGSTIQTQFQVKAYQVCVNQLAYAICPDADAAFSISNIAGHTAFHTFGIAANLYIDYLGAGANYFDATTTYFRTFAGANIGSFNSAGLTVNNNISIGGAIALASSGWMNIAPTIASGFCSTAANTSISASNGSASFDILIGGATCGSTGTLTMPAAMTGWVCGATDVTTPATHNIQQTGTQGSTTAVVLTDYGRVSGLAQNFNPSDHIHVQCTGY